MDNHVLSKVLINLITAKDLLRAELVCKSWHLYVHNFFIFMVIFISFI